jgi:hypothetical protein
VTIVDKTNAINFLCHPETSPKPSQGTPARKDRRRKRCQLWSRAPARDPSPTRSAGVRA